MRHGPEFQEVRGKAAPVLVVPGWLLSLSHLVLGVGLVLFPVKSRAFGKRGGRERQLCTYLAYFWCYFSSGGEQSCY